MQRMLGRAAAVAAGALMIAGMAAPAYAHVSTGGSGGGVVTADEPFVADWHEGWASTDDIHTKFEHAFWATAEATGHEGSHEVEIDGWMHSHHEG